MFVVTKALALSAQSFDSWCAKFTPGLPPLRPKIHSHSCLQYSTASIRPPCFLGGLRLSLSTRTRTAPPYYRCVRRCSFAIQYHTANTKCKCKSSTYLTPLPRTGPGSGWLATTHTSHGFTCPWLVSWWSYILPGFPPVWFPFLPKQQQHHERNTKIRIRVSCHSPDHRASSAQACHTSPYLCQQLVLPALLASGF